MGGVENVQAGVGQNNLPRFAIIGAGSRGDAYARAIYESKLGIVASVADPIASKRQSLGSKYIWSESKKQEDAEFESWQDFFKYEEARRKRQASSENVLPGVDGVFICTLDHTHKEIITSLAPLELHIMSEKPLATSLQDCIDIFQTIRPKDGQPQKTIFSVGHVLRYSPHNMLLHKLLLKDGAIGDILSIEHTEPVGWSHFSHSYVRLVFPEHHPKNRLTIRDRGNWRKESTTAPSLLTKCCHDIDFILWLLCFPGGPQSKPHLPYQVSSSGALSFFRKSRKPKEARKATNCMSCGHEPDCTYSAKKIYLESQLQKGNAGWPVNIVHPEIEDLFLGGDVKSAETRLLKSLSEDYTAETAAKDIDSRSWYGRCVWEADNDVCDDQVVTMTWKDDNTGESGSRSAKNALFHMAAFTESQCERRGRIYGTKGEIEYNSKMIRVFTFADQQAEVYHPHQPGGGHGGGDAGLAGQFVKAVTDVKNGIRSAGEAQSLHVGCYLEDIIRSHAMVFAAEEARLEGKLVDWNDWWAKNVLAQLNSASA